ncbi:MAG: NAD(P)H-hydrate epimerase [Actinomycetaceae bacterium]|nr:NAD(P)H-hydrate epimerase [Actinomycetaceae bacterium]
MKKTFSVQSVRAIEEPLLNAGRPLMRKAAYGLASECVKILKEEYGGAYGKKVLGLVGSGNNGGDTLYALAFLAKRSVYACAYIAHRSKIHTEAYEYAADAGVRFFFYNDDARSVVDASYGSTLIIDGLLGIGATGALRTPYDDILCEINNVRQYMDATYIAVDIPSGIDADTGCLSTSSDGESLAFKADITVTMGAYKPGLFTHAAREYVGRICLIDLDFPLENYVSEVSVIDQDECRDVLRIPEPLDHKYTRGVVGVIAGSSRYKGAGLLASHSALVSGVGMVRYLGGSDVGQILVEQTPEIVCESGRVQAWVIGSGIVADDRKYIEKIENIYEYALREKLPLVVDAGGIDILTLWMRVKSDIHDYSHIVITPHAGELSRLFSNYGHHEWSRERIEANPMEAARFASDMLGAHVYLKGAVNYIASPAGHTYLVSQGPSWTGTAGAGDVLAGTMGALLASSFERVNDISLIAAVAGYLHGKAALRASEARIDEYGYTRGGHPITAHDIIDNLPLAYGEIIEN